MEKNVNIVNGHLTFQKVSLKETNPSHYIHLVAEIDHSIFPFFLSTSRKKKAMIKEAKEWCSQLLDRDGVLEAIVFKATLIPPGKGKFLKERPQDVQVAKYDFAILIETESRQTVDEILQTTEYANITNKLKAISRLTHFITATNVRRIDSVNHNKQGVFLFNYFFADNLQQNLGIWEYTAGWFEQETHLDNSTVLLPTDQATSKYTIINHCRWDKMTDILPSLIFKKSFHAYVLDNFYANNVAAMPVLYKIA